MFEKLRKKTELDELREEEAEIFRQKKGRSAKGFHQFIIFASEVLTWTKADHAAAYAAQAAFFLVLSAFPFMIMILTFVQYLPFEQEDFIVVVRGLLPDEIEVWFMQMLMEMISNTNNAILSISILIALWSAARGILSISNGLNSVYRTQEFRNYFLLRFIAMGQTLIVAVGLVLLLLFFVLGNWINDRVVAQFSYVSQVEHIAGFIISVRIFVGLIVFFFVFVFLYLWLPNHKIKFRQAVPGAAFSAITWVFVSWLFSIYFTYFSSYARVYGSLTGMAISMVWVYTMMWLVLLGGEINVYVTVHYEDFINMFRVKFARKHEQKSVES